MSLFLQQGLSQCVLLLTHVMHHILCLLRLPKWSVEIQWWVTVDSNETEMSVLIVKYEHVNNIQFAIIYCELF